MLDLNETLRYVVGEGGSDLHLKVGSKPIVRVNGQLEPIEDEESLRPDDTHRILHEMLTEQSKLAEFNQEHEVDFPYSVPGLARFRVNAFFQRGTVSIVARVIPFAVRTIDELELPAVIKDVADEERGLILLTGTTGSGKSTTLAAMIDQINTTKRRHIVTIEDPIEYLHRDGLSIINQREVGMDTESFNRAMRRVLRQDPDVILIGEMRDEETVRSALSAAETGHLVLSTVHTLDGPETVNRIIDFFPQHEQSQARAMLAGTLKGIISQRLVPTPNGDGRVCVCEVLRMTGRVRDMIMDPDETGRLREVIMEGEYYGMQTFDQALLRHYQAGRVAMVDALRVASSPHDFKLLVATGGRTATSMDDLVKGEDGPSEEAVPAPAEPMAPSAPAEPVAPSNPPGPAPPPMSSPAPGGTVAPPPPRRESVPVPGR
ncbi:MAG TPA: type IV pilus twitching motility protein PilT [Solirubrobacteraceae bacterium]|jgi:twitching motility protein PilT